MIIQTGLLLLTLSFALCGAAFAQAQTARIAGTESDPKASNEFSELLKKLSGQGCAVLMATNDLFRAKESGTRVGIMKHGRSVTELSTDELGHPDHGRVYLENMRN